jgi:hypothetical protein
MSSPQRVGIQYVSRHSEKLAGILHAAYENRTGWLKFRPA